MPRWSGAPSALSHGLLLQDHFCHLIVYIDRILTLYNSPGMRSIPRPLSDAAVIRAVAGPLVLALIALAAFDMVSVAGPSMEPTLVSGDRVLVFRGAYGVRPPWQGPYLFRWREPGRGDIVLLENPTDGNPVVKRCVGVPGDRLIFAHENIYVAGIPYSLDTASLGGLKDYRRIPPGSYFVVGDNLDTSTDSRHYGLVSRDYLLGKVIP